MLNEIQQFKAIEDDCVYFYDFKLKKFRKICDVPSFDELPLSIKRQLRAARKDAESILAIPDR